MCVACVACGCAFIFVDLSNIPYTLQDGVVATDSSKFILYCLLLLPHSMWSLAKYDLICHIYLETHTAKCRFCCLRDGRHSNKWWATTGCCAVHQQGIFGKSNWKANKCILVSPYNTCTYHSLHQMWDNKGTGGKKGSFWCMNKLGVCELIACKKSHSLFF